MLCAAKRDSRLVSSRPRNIGKHMHVRTTSIESPGAGEWCALTVPIRPREESSVESECAEQHKIQRTQPNVKGLRLGLLHLATRETREHSTTPASHPDPGSSAFLTMRLQMCDLHHRRRRLDVDAHVREELAGGSWDGALAIISVEKGRTAAVHRSQQLTCRVGLAALGSVARVHTWRPVRVEGCDVEREWCKGEMCAVERTR